MEISCIVIDDEPYAIAELSALIVTTPGIYMLNSFDNVHAAVEYFDEHGPIDVIFSDIEMPMLNGISAAKILRGYCDYLIYVTAHRKFALDAFGVNAAGYLLKPVSQQALINKVSEVREELKKRKNDRTLDLAFVKGGNKNAFIKLQWDDVIYVQALLNYVNIHTTNGHEVTYIGLKTLGELLKERKHFFQISKSVIINLNYIERVDGNTVKLTSNEIFTVGEKNRSAFHEFLRERTLNP